MVRECSEEEIEHEGGGVYPGKEMGFAEGPLTGWITLKLLLVRRG